MYDWAQTPYNNQDETNETNENDQTCTRCGELIPEEFICDGGFTDDYRLSEPKYADSWICTTCWDAIVLGEK